MSPLSELPGALSDQGTGQEPPAIRQPPPGPLSTTAAERLRRVECPAFSHRRQQRAQAAGTSGGPIVLASGKGSNLWDVDGNRYVDLAAGFGAVLLGHGPPGLTGALQGQCERLVQGLGDVYAADLKVALLERLTALHPGERPQALLGQTGSDAVTAAMKTASLATGRPGFVAFEGAYHGLGFGPLAACGLRASYRAPFADQLNPHVRFAPYPGHAGASLDDSLETVKREIERAETAAVLVEPVLGRGGCVVPPAGFVAELCALAHESGALVIADEIWTGLGRAGALVCSVELGAPVDILCFGKGLGGGLAISACVAPEPIMRAWARDEEVVHTSTHCGAPLPCAAAFATLNALRAKRVVERTRDLGERFRHTLAEDLADCAEVTEVRGVGLMIGIAFRDAPSCQAAVRALLTRGYIVLTGGTAGDVLTLTPALNIDEALLLGFGTALRELLRQ